MSTSKAASNAEEESSAVQEIASCNKSDKDNAKESICNSPVKELVMMELDNDQSKVQIQRNDRFKEDSRIGFAAAKSGYDHRNKSFNKSSSKHYDGNLTTKKIRCLYDQSASA